MGSTDSAGNTHGGGSSCGFVSSLFPNSCRGRAESFARRLHRRLTSLGGEGVSATADDEAESMNFLAKSTANKVNETSWLHGPSGKRETITLPLNPTGYSCSRQMDERVLDSQPRHSPESDVYYDFDHDPYENNASRENGDVNDEYSTNSPAEIATDADVANIILNRKITRFDHRDNRNIGQENSRFSDYLQDSESDCLYASPLPGTSPDTDTSDMFFDPESSETEKTCDSLDNVTAYDNRKNESDKLPADAETKDDKSVTCKIRKRPLCRRKNRRIVTTGEQRSDENNDDDDDDNDDADDDDDDDTSHSSSSFSNPNVDGENFKSPEKRFTASSEESLNGNKSSLETTTSQSHESLWSTFDENTLSNHDESSTASPATIPISPGQMTLAKSHSDSEIGSKTSRTNEIDEVDYANTMLPLTNGKNIEDSTKFRNNHSIYRNTIDIPRDIIAECTSDGMIVSSDEKYKNQVNNFRTDDVKSCEMSKLLERLKSNPIVENIEATKSSSNDDDVEAVKKMTNGSSANDEKDEDIETRSIEVDCEKIKQRADDDDEDEGEDDDNNRPQRLRRCSSLKTGKTPPGTPCRKKIVRFADVLGLDLADVRTFLDEIPKIPNSAYSDLIYDEAFQKDSSPANVWCHRPAVFTARFNATLMSRNNGTKNDGILVPLFQQPGGTITFLDRVREKQVCLENILIEDPVNMCIRGTVRCRNLDFHKSVHIRYTLDSWRSFSDLQATYVPNSCDGFSDKFTFLLYCHTLKIGQRLELAVRFQCKGSQYWDNNDGTNYCIQCLPATTTNPGYIPITTTTTMINTAVSPSMSHANHPDWSPTFY